MRYLAVVERKNPFASPLLRLLSKQVDEHCWSPAHGELPAKLDRRFRNNALVLAHVSSSHKLLRVEPLAEPLLEVLHGLSDYIKRFSSTDEEIEGWRLSLQLQSEELRRRELELASLTGKFTQKDQLLLPPAPEELLPKKTTSRRRKHSINVMEKLVIREFETQIARMPGAMQSQIDRTDVEVWALNRLPAVYATGKRGLKMLEERAQQDHAEEITRIVREGIQVVHRNDQPPGEASQPLEEAQPVAEYA